MLPGRSNAVLGTGDLRRPAMDPNALVVLKIENFQS